MLDLSARPRLKILYHNLKRWYWHPRAVMPPGPVVPVFNDSAYVTKVDQGQLDDSSRPLERGKIAL
jgi:hypothetical protein